ncbi:MULTISPECIES: DUF2510 domain-containing protein [Oerskovia]|uniref:DUF2510 domain-containing protein n=2 Tax=Oerskovia TaxID=162491 RepID=A0ABR8V1K6_9CELL|nr:MULTISPECIES: DUF2510 domain-containing protein [Oerskovia]MBD7998659.1 DUF2510 domain-containing protein [Oerskovia gallyi]MBM7497359.1 hypothetical protein [Oerskovia paurometabola]
MTYQPGWYPDPQDQRRVRWFDGIRWTEHWQPGAVPPPARPRTMGGGTIALIVVGAIVLLVAMVVVVVVVVAVFAGFADIVQGVVCGEAPHYCT